MKIRLKIIENMQCVEFHIQILGEEHIRREIQVLFVFLMDFIYLNSRGKEDPSAFPLARYSSC